MPRESSLGTWLVVLGLTVVGALGFAILRAQQLPEGPQSVAWDREPCAHCHMHVSEPSFAAQLHTTDGRVLHFDDPGCLLRFVVAQSPEVRATWFHDAKADAWIPGEKARFVKIEPTPMGYGLGATPGPAGRRYADVLAEARLLVGKGH